MKLAMLGGTYDPIHLGHIMLGQKFVRSEGLDKVLIVPTKVPPHKAASTTPAELRLAMCRLAAEYAGDEFEASDIELRRDGLSYSYYTVLELLEKYPENSELYLITGADMFMTLETWHEFDKMNKLVTFCTVPRGDITFAQLSAHARELGERTRCGRYIIAEEPLMDVSSTVIRAAVAAGEPIGKYVPPAIAEYIKKNGLYKPKE